MNARQRMTTLEVSFPQTGVDLSITPKSTVDLLQVQDSHDIATITLPFQRFDGVRTKLGYGSACTFTWTTPTGRQTFVGHIHTVKPWVTEDGNGTQIIAVSAGFPLKRRQQRIWTQVTATDVARSLAMEHRLNVDIEPHPRVFPQIAQSDQSDWALLRGLAQRIGYSLRVEGVTLQFTSKRTLERYYRPMALEVTVAPTDDSIEPGLRDVLTFVPALGEHQPERAESLARRRLATLDRSGHVIAALSTSVTDPGRKPLVPLYDQFVNEVARSVEESNQIVTDASERARYPVRASAMIYGNPLIAPNRILLIQGQTNDVSGYWTVLRAEHHIIPGTGYTMDLELGSEGLGEELMTPVVTRTSGPVTGLLKTPYPSAVLVKDESGGANARWIPSFS